MMLVSLVASLPLLAGETSSATLERFVDDTVVTLWGVCLFSGSILALVGEWWRWRLYHGWLLERFGLQLVMIGAMVYAFVIAYSASPIFDVWYVLSLQTGFALACAVRARQIGKKIVESQRAMGRRG